MSIFDNKPPDLQQGFNRKSLRIGEEAGVEVSRQKASLVTGGNFVSASTKGLNLSGRTVSVLATPESFKFSFMYAHNMAAISPMVPAYFISPPVEGIVYMATTVAEFATLAAAGAAIGIAVAAGAAAGGAG